MSDGGAQHITFGPFFDTSGSEPVLLPNIKVYHYAAGTTSNADMWSDENKATPVAQPFIGDTSGIARIFGDNIYKIVIHDENDNLLYTWDNYNISRNAEGVLKNATSYPAINANNAWQLAVKKDGLGNFIELGISDGSSFITLITQAGTDYLRVSEPAAAALNKNWDINAISEQLLIRAANDDFSAFTNILTVDRTDMVVDLVNVVSTTLQHNGVTILDAIDEDDMASDSATNVPTQQSSKAYTDAHGIVQQVNVQDGAVNTGVTVLPYDDTVPQNSEGDEFMALAITPTSSSNKLKIEVVCNLAHSAGTSDVLAALFKDAITGALAAGQSSKANATNQVGQVCFTHYMVAGSTSAITFKVRAGSSVAGTTTFNGVGGVRRFGGVMASSITITEVKA